MARRPLTPVYTHPPVAVWHEVFLRDARLDEVIIELKFEPKLIMEGLDQERSLMIMFRGLKLMGESQKILPGLLQSI